MAMHAWLDGTRACAVTCALMHALLSCELSQRRLQLLKQRPGSHFDQMPNLKDAYGTELCRYKLIASRTYKFS